MVASLFIFNAVFPGLRIDWSLGYLTDKTQPARLSTTLTATLTRRVKPYPPDCFFLSIAPLCFFFFILSDSDELLDEQYLFSALFLFHSAYQLYAHVLCMFPQRQTRNCNIHTTAALHNLQ